MTPTTADKPRDCITILTSKRRLATKRITPGPDGRPTFNNYGNAAHFRIDEAAISCFAEMVAVLSAIEREPFQFIVRARPKPGIDRRNARRRLYDRENGDGSVQPATLESIARHWIAIDFDSVPCPEAIDPVHEPGRVVEHVVKLLPPEFRGVSCWWAFTSGHGIKPGIRIRLFFFSDRAIEDWELKEWLHNSPVDRTIFAPVQPIYVARPIFEGVADPVPVRSGVWSGDRDEITPPCLADLKVAA